MTTLTFQNKTLSVINQNNQIWMTVTEIGNALGYSDPFKSVKNIYDRHQDEFTPCMTALIDMQTNGGKQQVRIFSLRGAHLIAMFARTKVAKEFRKWVLDILDKEVLQNSAEIKPLALTTITPEEQLMVQNAVKATHNRTGLSYGEIWARTKNKFKVAKYEQIERPQLREVLIYIASISAIRTAGKDEIIISADLFEAILKHTRLAKRLAEQTEIFHRQLYVMLGLERHIRNEIGAISYDVAHSFNSWLQKGEDILALHRPLALPSL